MSLAEKITELRKKQGWSQIDLADRLDVSRQSVSKWEMGQAVPELDKIIKMSELFSVSTDYLLKEDVSQPEAAPAPPAGEEGGAVPPPSDGAPPQGAGPAPVPGSAPAAEPPRKPRRWIAVACVAAVVAIAVALVGMAAEEFLDDRRPNRSRSTFSPSPTPVSNVTETMGQAGATPSPAPAASQIPATTAQEPVSPSAVPAASPADVPAVPTNAPAAATNAPATSSVGVAGGISLEDAKAAALADAGLAAENANFTKTRSDYDDGAAVYEIEFNTDSARYEYEISASDGSVWEKNVNFWNVGAGTTAGNPIGEDRAREIALGNAGFAAADVRFDRTDFDRDDGRMEYEVEFFANGGEYDYTIDAVSGEILEYSVDLRF